MPKRTLTPEEEAERTARRNAQNVKRVTKHRLKVAQDKVQTANASVEAFKAELKRIVKEEVANFEELRGLAMSAIKEMLISGAPREKLQAANMVLSRTDPEKKVMLVEVDIHPVDLSQFRCLPSGCNESVIDVQCLPYPSVPTLSPT